jgi:multisubunit Na+/H+ antiporter MnhC subunit
LFQLGLTTDKCYSLEIMPTIKRAEKFMDRQGAAILGLAISSMAILAITMYLVADPTLQKVLGATWFVGTGIVLVVVLSRMGRAFRCPDCGGSVGPLLDTDGKFGTPLLQPCVKCDVLWQVGTEPD